MFGELQNLSIDISNSRKHRPAMDLGRCSPRAFRRSNGVLLKNLHHKKQALNFKPKKGPFQQETSLPTAIFQGTFEF